VADEREGLLLLDIHDTAEERERPERRALKVVPVQVPVVGRDHTKQAGSLGEDQGQGLFRVGSVEGHEEFGKHGHASEHGLLCRVCGVGVVFADEILHMR